MFSSFQYALWILGFVAHVVLLAIILIRKKLHGVTPFVAFLAYAPIVNVILFVVSRYGGKWPYFYTYYTLGFSEYPLQLFVIWHISKKLLSPVATLYKSGQPRIGLLLAIGLFVLCSAGIGIASGGAPVNGSWTDVFDLWENRASIFVSLLICGTIVCIFFTANRYYLQLGRHVFAIGQGLFIWSYGALLADFVHSFVGMTRWYYQIGYAQNSTYLGVLCYWMFVFWKEEPIKPALPEDVVSYMARLHQAVRLDLDRTGGRLP